MTYEVVVLPEARDDVTEIFMYVAKNDNLSKAGKLLDNIERRLDALKQTPQRGHDVPELKRIHVIGFREIHFKPYRIIYQIIEKKVFIHAVLDGRRELQELLEQRLLR